MTDRPIDEDELGSEHSEAVGQREVMSLISSSPTSVLPATTEGTGLAESASGTATDAPSTADDVDLPAADTSGGSVSSSQPGTTSDEPVSESFHSSDTASSET